MLIFKKSVIGHDSIYQLEKLTGIIAENNERHRFEAFLFKIQKNKVSIQLKYANPPLTISEMLENDTRYVGGINGGFYKLTEFNRTPLDWVVINGKQIQKLKNLNRPCIFLENGVSTISDPSYQGKYSSVLQAGPILLKNGDIIHDYFDFQINAKDFDTDITANRNPRTIFGYDNEFLYCLVVNGRSDTSVGLYLEEASELALKCGFLHAINLDGGGSCTLIINNELINDPRFDMKSQPNPLDEQIQGFQRKIPTALLFFKK